MSQLGLIIEDDEDLASIFAEALRGVGFDVFWERPRCTLQPYRRI